MGPSCLPSSVDLGVYAFQDFRRVLVLEHVHDAFYRVRVGVFAENALALLMAVCRLAEVAHQDRHAVSLGDDDIAEIVQCAHHADAADDIALLAARDAAAAGIRAVVVDRGGHIVQADAVTLKLGGIKLKLILHGEAAEIIDVSHAGHLLQCRDDDPALDFRKLHQVLGIRLQGVAVDFADRTGYRIEARLDAGREGYLIDALRDPLARPVVFGAVAKHQGNERQAERAARTYGRQAGCAGQRPLQRDRYLLFDFLGGQSRRRGGNLCGDIADFRISFDRHFRPGVIAENGKQDRHH